MKDKKVIWIRRALIAAAVGFLIFGISRGEAGTVLKKAVNICLECIGIG